MAFIPKLAPSDEEEPPTAGFSSDPAEPLELPEAEFALGSQLAQEALALAARYPAGRGAGECEVHRPSARVAEYRAIVGLEPQHQGGRFLGPAIAILLATLAAGSAPWFWQAGHAGIETQAATSSDVTQSTAPVASAVPPSRTTPTGETSAIPAETSTFVHELTGPELEGLLDILEVDPTAELRLSI